ncbi:Type VI secretion protein [Bosea sp. 62]|uniref:relaxase/mobilization nuclease domain-containing protein n=1 Tax=unclassified Bosea (in: a-proteobacteria) TaxID=2653178 RepID=UPI00125A7321|nr:MULTISPECIES: relaxase/mobilization nuclease domain-containing protein [unclassified Bosea (in: a-proteobacteria)]CAD5271121.1 Type VI secretion protein [Bosea sp. 21B]CAD5291656.1 Type VI secretion protein [Bosea sp. 46]CAD5300691.1 Type VI secretion protein [Bosea sp. 7B]VVT60737.1 Type VI secretion protein [Bosea sp. EC-HK365B]VXC04358.1 Type VI secretion protein [Bosea sp. 62]
MSGKGAKELLDDLPPISYVWRTPVRRPRVSEADIPDPVAPQRVTPAMRARLERIVGRAPEVMVKITGRTKDAGHLKSHLEYIMRNGELTAETEQGSLMQGREGLKDLQSRWTDDTVLDDKRRRDGSVSVNIILSMPPGTDPIAVKDAVRAFAIETFGPNHDYVFVQHLDDKHPHVHLTVRSQGYNGKRLNPRKADLAAWRERFAGELRLRGVAAEATPRRTRGKVRKYDKGTVVALRRRGVVPDTDKGARHDVVRAAKAGVVGARPWEQKARDRQVKIRAQYLAHAKELERTGKGSDRALAMKVREFVAKMPDPETRREQLVRELASAAQRTRPVRDQAPDRKGRDTDRQER